MNFNLVLLYRSFRFNYYAPCGLHLLEVVDDGVPGSALRVVRVVDKLPVDPPGHSR